MMPANNYTPDYKYGFPEIDPGDFHSDPNPDLGYIEGLYSTALDSISGFYGSEDIFDPQNLENFDPSFLFDLKKMMGPLIYVGFWLLVALIMTITGCCWCCCNKCNCCCRRGFESKSSGRVAPQKIEPAQVQGAKKLPKESLIATGAMGVWLFMFFLIMIYSFGAPEYANDAIRNIYKDFRNSFDDADLFLEKCQAQMQFMYIDGVVRMKGSIVKVLEDSDKSYPLYTKVESETFVAIHDCQESFNETISGFHNTLQTIRDKIQIVSEKLDSSFEHYIVKVNENLYWTLVLFNVLYLFIFLALSIGMILAWVGRSIGQKIAGHLIIRGGFVPMFILPLFIWLQMTLIFVAVGIITTKFCPGLIVDEDKIPTLSAGDVPTYEQIVGNCRQDLPAYRAFNLNRDPINKPEMDVRKHDAKVQEFRNKFADIKPNPPSPPSTPPGKMNPEETMAEIINQADQYINQFLVPTVENDAGKCLIGYNAIYSLITLVCIKVPGPLLGYWFLMQFIMPLFTLMIATGIAFGYFERKRLLGGPPTTFQQQPYNMTNNMTPNAAVPPPITDNNNAVPPTPVTKPDVNANP